MDKPKEMNYNIAPMRKILLTEAVSDGGTQEKAAALKGKWIRLNEHEYVLEEADKTTRVYNDETECGCACKTFNSSSMNVLCEHIIAFNGLTNHPQLSIESSQCRGLREVLLAEGWYTENRYLYPSLDDEQPDEPEVVVEEEPVIDEEPEPKMIERKCDWCGHVESGTDAAEVKQLIAEHRETCPKNPADKKKTPKPTQEPVVKESLATEKPKEDKKTKPSTAVTKSEPRTPSVKKEMPTEAQFQTAAVGRIMKNQGSIYKVGGKEVADSAAVSNYAVLAGVSTETTVLEQTTEYARATVRAYKGGRYTEGSVLIRKDAILEKLMIDLAEKNPKWIVGWSNGLPEFDLDQKVYIGDKQKILGLHIAGTLIDKWTFAARDCETKARRRAQIQMLGADWREEDEVDSEVEEMGTVAKRR